MKKLVSILVIASLMMSVFYGCGSSDDNYSSDYIEQLENGFFDETGNEYQEDETPEVPEENAEDETQSFKYKAEKNEDGVYDLMQGDYTYSMFKQIRYLLDDGSGFDKGDHLLVCGYDNARIAMFNKNDTVAIYFDSDELAFIKLTADISYTPNINFMGYDEVRYDKDPYSISSTNFYLRDWIYDFSDSDEVEINGEDYNKFLDKHTIHLKEKDDYLGNYFAIIDAEKDEKITIGGYKGTDWIEYDFYADGPFWCQDSYKELTVPVEKTRNGYFTVDLSGLEPGLYCIVDEYNYEKVIEITE